MTDDTELDGLIVRNIADLEASILCAIDLGHELAGKAMSAVERFAATKDWFCTSPSKHGIDAHFGPREWIGEDGTPRFWFCLGEVCPHDDGDESWITEFAGKGPSGTSIQLLFDQGFLSEAKMRKLLSTGPAVVAPLKAAGFQVDAFYIVTPLTLDLEAIAVAFEQDDFDAALSPLEMVLQRAADAVPQFEALAARVYAQATT